MGGGSWLPEDWEPEKKKASVGGMRGRKAKPRWEEHGGRMQLRWTLEWRNHMKQPVNRNDLV